MGTFPDSKSGLHATFWFKLDQNSRERCGGPLKAATDFKH